MTPLHLEILMHYYTSRDPFPRDSQGIRSYRLDLIGLCLLDSSFIVTSKGEAWIKHILETPMPTQKWVWE